MFMKNASTMVGLDMKETGRRIGNCIDKSGLSDRQLSRQMGISVQSINKWRHGKSLPDIENLFILGKILGIRTDDFLVPVMSKDSLFVYGKMLIPDLSSRRNRLTAYYVKLKEVI